MIALCLGISCPLNIALGAQAGSEKEPAGQVEKATDKAGDQSEKAMEKAGSAVDKAVDTTGKALGKAGRSTADAFKKAGNAISDFFDGDDQPGTPEARSERVREVQLKLHEKGYYDGEIDGIPGPKTRTALREYQRENNLEVTGRLNAESARSMEL
jgi:peptidoglycan hydrolase-like protein with peptidoglycan-binding domain